MDRYCQHNLLPILQYSLAKNSLEVVKAYGVSMREGHVLT